MSERHNGLRPFYDSLLSRKKKGEKLELDTLTHNQFKLLVAERCIDAEVADIFDLSKRDIRKRRQELGVDAIAVDAETYVPSILEDSLEEYKKEILKGMIEVSQEEAELLKIIRGLNITMDMVIASLYRNRELSGVQREQLLTKWRNSEVL